MMNITLLAAQAALADTLAGGNPTLTHGKRRMDHACAGSAVRCVFLYLF